MPVSIYKWEDNNRGLDHKCGTCGTVLSSPRAKKTCFGKHEEICTRYHKTLFFLGASHNCDACYKTVELHHKRHREILDYVREIQRIDDFTSGCTPYTKKKGRPKWNDTPDNPGSTISASQRGDDGEHNSTDSSTLNGMDEDGRDSEKEHQDIQLDAIGDQIMAQDGRPNDRSETIFQIVTASDLEHVQSVLHPESMGLSSRRASDGQGLTDNAVIQMNISFNSHCSKCENLRPSNHQKQLATAVREEPANQSDRSSMKKLLSLLGINRTPLRNPKDRKQLLNKLITAIQADLLAHENEQAQTMRRMAGYWRYANRRTYNAMVRTNMLWDWGTGEKLPEIEETELDDLVEDDAASLGGSTQVGTPPDETEAEAMAGDKPKALPETPSRHGSAEVQSLSIEGGTADQDLNTSPILLHQKDDRLLSKAIRAASPPRKQSRAATGTYATIALPSIATKAEHQLVEFSGTDLNAFNPGLFETSSSNAFDALESEIPAPCEELRLVGAQAQSVARRKVRKVGAPDVEDYPALKTKQPKMHRKAPSSPQKGSVIISKSDLAEQAKQSTATKTGTKIGSEKKSKAAPSPNTPSRPVSNAGGSWADIAKRTKLR